MVYGMAWCMRQEDDEGGLRCTCMSKLGQRVEVHGLEQVNAAWHDMVHARTTLEHEMTVVVVVGSCAKVSVSRCVVHCMHVSRFICVYPLVAVLKGMR